MKRKLFLILVILITYATLSCSTVSQRSTAPNEKVAEIEDYLVDFSKKMEGHRLLNGSLPSDLDSDKFFSILNGYYIGNKEPIRKVRDFPVQVHKEGDSYVLIICDNESELALYKDHGKTTTYVDFPYWREGKRITCSEALK